MDNELLVKSIRNLCKKNNIAISQLENKLNFGAGLISRWSKSSPSLDKIIDIANYFNVSLDEVVGRNNKKDKSELITTLKNLTTLDAIQWSECTNQSISPLYDNLVLFELQNINYEIFSTQYNESILFIVAEYNNSCGTMQDLKCSLFIQPDIESMPVLQPEEGCEELWLLVHTSLKGTPDEHKAVKVKQQIINSKDEIVFNNLPQYFKNAANNNEEIDKLINNSDIKETIIKMDSPEILQMIKTFTDSNMINSINAANRMIKYFSEIKKIKEQQKTDSTKIEE